MSMSSEQEKNFNYRGAASGWESITDPFALMMAQLYDAPKQEPGSHTYTFQGNQRRSWYGGQPGLAPPPPSTGKFHFSAGGGAPSTSSTTAGGSATTAGTSSGTTFGNVVAGQSTTAPAAAGTNWGAWAKGGLTAASAYQNAKQNAAAAKAAGQAQNVTRTPYMANMLNPFIPYILQEALNIYASRQKNAGRQVGDYNPLAAILGQFFNNYTNQGRP